MRFVRKETEILAYSGKVNTILREIYTLKLDEFRKLSKGPGENSSPKKN